MKKEIKVSFFTVFLLLILWFPAKASNCQVCPAGSKCCEDCSACLADGLVCPNDCPKPCVILPVPNNQDNACLLSPDVTFMCPENSLPIKVPSPGPVKGKSAWKCGTLTGTSAPKKNTKS